MKFSKNKNMRIPVDLIIGSALKAMIKNETELAI